jgi:acyl-coenzyme A synthetase/AMP-(fatty) acid ligase
MFKKIKPSNNHTAVITDNNISLTYSELCFESKKLYSHINHRCLVICLCENSLGSLIGYISFLKNKIVPLMLDNEIDINFLENLIKIYSPEYIYAPSSLVSKFHYTKVYEKFDYVLLKTNIETSFPLNENLALLLTTSGSTGSPKFVRQSYKNILSNTKSIVKYLKLKQEDRPITTLPMYYTYGLSIINSHLYTGSTILFTKYSIVQKKFWDFFKDKKATTFGGVPFTYEILKKLHFLEKEYPSLNYMTQAGGKLSTELINMFRLYAERRNIKFYVMYGQTEATARMSYLNPKNLYLKCGSIGKSIPNGELFLIDKNKNIIKDSFNEGELVYKGDNVALGYAESGEDLIKGDEFLGILYTGDLAKKDDDGFFYITGRKKRFIKAYGSRINLDEIEQLLYPSIGECACVGEDDKILIYVTNYEKIGEAKRLILSSHIRVKTIDIKFINKIPRNEFGKVLYGEL